MSKLVQAQMFPPAPVEAGLPLWSGQPEVVDEVRASETGPEVQLRLPDMPSAEVVAIVRDRDAARHALLGGGRKRRAF